jgi:hypothetical protein
MGEPWLVGWSEKTVRKFELGPGAALLLFPVDTAPLFRLRNPRIEGVVYDSGPDAGVFLSWEELALRRVERERWADDGGAQ